MGVKRKLDDERDYTEIMCNEYRTYTIAGDTTVDRRWQYFVCMIEFCALRLAYEAIGLDATQLNAIDRRYEYFSFGKRDLKMGITTNGEHKLSMLDGSYAEDAREFVFVWNKCLVTCLVDLNRLFAREWHTSGCLKVMRDNYVVPIRAHIRLLYNMPEPPPPPIVLDEDSDDSD